MKGLWNVTKRTLPCLLKMIYRIIIQRNRRRKMRYNTCVVFGGKSVEHEVSIITAAQLVENISQKTHRVFPIYLTKNNEFFYAEAMKDIAFFKVKELRMIEN